jgi:type IV pilus assembly protein PilN
MIRINLLPHRQIRRAEKQREFNLMATLVAIAAAAILFLGWSYIKAKIESQNSRNQRIEDAMLQLDTEIKDISSLKDQINNVLERKQIVQNLQSDRNQAVIVLDEIARQLPEGIYIKNIKQQGTTIDVLGVADSNARVADLVRNLGQSKWMENPNLVEIKADNSNVNSKKYDFTLKVSLKKANVPKQDESKQGQPGTP